MRRIVLMFVCLLLAATVGCDGDGGGDDGTTVVQAASAGDGGTGDIQDGGGDTGSGGSGTQQLAAGTIGIPNGAAVPTSEFQVPGAGYLIIDVHWDVVIPVSLILILNGQEVGSVTTDGDVYCRMTIFAPFAGTGYFLIYNHGTGMPEIQAFEYTVVYSAE